ncbi:2-hydroxyacid dehydrogenase [Streptomyces sp. NPDC005438]|uniref:2-hydroxyacid dehydrogenase n=1 Tax=Streptomyces sp. NPDC005438 TaxID=3156880 RepID=UPI0033A44002
MTSVSVSADLSAAPDVWLPIPPEEIEELPEGPRYLYWNGDGYPDDPARCGFYVVPYMKGPEVAVRPLAEMSRVRVVQTLTAGVDHVAPAVDRLPSGTLLCNARGVHDTSTSELALTLILASLRAVPEFVRAQEREVWLPDVHPALADRTVLILGYGAIGSAVEDRLVPFEVSSVLRVARKERSSPRGPVHGLDALPGLLPRADVVVVCTPLTEQTRHLVDADFLARMKDGALLVNVARGGVVDTEALLAEQSGDPDRWPRGRLRAALDVTDPEPLPSGHPLWRAPGVLITPHVGGPSSAFLPRARRMVRAQLWRWVSGEPLEYTVARAG